MSSCAVEEDDNGEKVVFVFVKLGPDWRLMVLSDRVFHGRTKESKFDSLFSCVGACYKVEEGMNLFNFFFFYYKFSWLGYEVVVGGGGCDCGRWWQWVLAVAVGLLVVKEMRMRIKINICGCWYWGEAGLWWWLAVASLGCGLCYGLRKMERQWERETEGE